MALMDGIFNSKISFASLSELKDHMSSSDPPPLAKITASTLLRSFNILTSDTAFNKLSSELSPCTKAGINEIFIRGALLLITFFMSCITAPFADEITAMCRGR